MSIEDDVFGIGGDGVFGVESDPVAQPWQPTPWWAWTVAALLLGAVLLLVAGTSLASADLGTSLRARGCDTSALTGLLLLLAGALVLALGFQLARLRTHGAVIAWDLGVLVVAVPIPATLLVATIPGVLGCALGADIAAIGLVGDALVGQPGLALAAASAALTGVALAASAHVTWLTPGSATSDAPPGIVELAMQEAEALEAEGATSRFHNVDSDH